MTSKLASSPVEFSKLMRPFVYDELSNATIEKMNNLTFFRQLLQDSTL
jgi:hypothetical protein